MKMKSEYLLSFNGVTKAVRTIMMEAKNYGDILIRIVAGFKFVGWMQHGRIKVSKVSNGMFEMR